MAFGKKLMRLNILSLELQLYEVETLAIPRHTEKDPYLVVLSPQTKGFRGPINGFVSRSTASHLPPWNGFDRAKLTVVIEASVFVFIAFKCLCQCICIYIGQVN